MNTNVGIIASTIVQLAQFGVICYGISAARAFLLHWLDRRFGPFIERRTTAAEDAIDAARWNGVEGV